MHLFHFDQVHKLENPRKFAACSDGTREKSYQTGGKSGAETDSCLATTPLRLETIWRSEDDFEVSTV